MNEKIKETLKKEMSQSTWEEHGELMDMWFVTEINIDIVAKAIEALITEREREAVTDNANKVIRELIDYLKQDRVEQIAQPFKYGDCAKEIIDYMKEVKFEAKRTEERTIAKLAHTGAIFTHIDEDGKQRWFRVEEVSNLSTTKEGE